MPSGTKRAPGPLSKELGDILRAQMARKRISQTSLSKAAGISQAQLSGVLSGNKHVDVEQLDEMCWSLGLSLVDVISEAENAAVDRQVSSSWVAERLVQD